MATLYNYSTTDVIPFKVTKDGAGVASLTFSTGDIYVSVDNGAWVDISSEVTELVGSGSGKGWYKWTPSVTTNRTDGEYIVINISEAVGTNFDENGIVCYTGGNASARYSG